MRREYNERGPERPRREERHRDEFKREFEGRGPRRPAPERPRHDRPRPEKQYFDGPRPERHHQKRPRRELTTKLFTDQKEMVTYVNELGEQGAKIDIFKIDESLYKVEVFKKVKKEIKIEVE